MGASLVAGGVGTYISSIENERLRAREEEFDEDVDDGVKKAEAEIEDEVDELNEERAELAKELSALEGALAKGSQEAHISFDQ